MARIPTRVALLVGAALIAGGAAAVAVLPDTPSAGRDQSHQGASTAATVQVATHQAGLPPAGSGATPTTMGDGAPPKPPAPPVAPAPGGSASLAASGRSSAPTSSGAAPASTAGATTTRPVPSSSPGGPQPFTRGSTLSVSACTVSYVISDAAVSPSRTTITYQGTPAECASLVATLALRVGKADPADPGWTVVSVSTVTETTALVTSNDVVPAPGADSGS